jgi:hypothetical protein
MGGETKAKKESSDSNRLWARADCATSVVEDTLLLILFAEGLDVGFAVGVEEVFAALLPGGF